MGVLSKNGMFSPALGMILKVFQFDVVANHTEQIFDLPILLFFHCPYVRRCSAQARSNVKSEHGSRISQTPPRDGVSSSDFPEVTREHKRGAKRRLDVSHCNGYF